MPACNKRTAERRRRRACRTPSPAARTAVRGRLLAREAALPPSPAPRSRVVLGLRRRLDGRGLRRMGRRGRNRDRFGGRRRGLPLGAVAPGSRFPGALWLRLRLRWRSPRTHVLLAARLGRCRFGQRLRRGRRFVGRLCEAGRRPAGRVAVGLVPVVAFHAVGIGGVGLVAVAPAPASSPTATPAATASPSLARILAPAGGRLLVMGLALIRGLVVRVGLRPRAVGAVVGGQVLAFAVVGELRRLGGARLARLLPVFAALVAPAAPPPAPGTPALLAFGRSRCRRFLLGLLLGLLTLEAPLHVDDGAALAGPLRRRLGGRALDGEIGALHPLGG